MDAFQMPMLSELASKIVPRTLTVASLGKRFSCGNCDLSTKTLTIAVCVRLSVPDFVMTNTKFVFSLSFTMSNSRRFQSTKAPSNDFAMDTGCTNSDPGRKRTNDGHKISPASEIV